MKKKIASDVGHTLNVADIRSHVIESHEKLAKTQRKWSYLLEHIV